MISANADIDLTDAEYFKLRVRARSDMRDLGLYAMRYNTVAEENIICLWHSAQHLSMQLIDLEVLRSIWVRSRNCGCLVTWFCYQLIAKPGNNTATVS